MTTPSDTGQERKDVWTVDTAQPVPLPDGRTLTLGDVVRMEYMPVELVPEEEIGGDSEASEAGSPDLAGISAGGVETQIEVGGQTLEFVLFPGPDAPVAEAWDHHYRYTLLDAWDERAELRIDELTDEVVAGSAQRLHIEADESKRIAPGVWLRFVRHSHKDPPVGHPGALVVYVHYHGEPEARDDGGQSYALYGEGYYTLSAADARPHWRWRDFRFTLEDSEYGKSMDLLVERLRMKPVAPPAPAPAE